MILFRLSVLTLFLDNIKFNSTSPDHQSHRHRHNPFSIRLSLNPKHSQSPGGTSKRKSVPESSHRKTQSRSNDSDLTSSTEDLGRSVRRRVRPQSSDYVPFIPTDDYGRSATVLDSDSAHSTEEDPGTVTKKFFDYESIVRTEDEGSAGTLDAGTLGSGTLDAGTLDSGTLDAKSESDSGEESLLIVTDDLTGMFKFPGYLLNFLFRTGFLYPDTEFLQTS